jgi:heme oxygenase (mycobilin-producing)
VAMGEGGGLPVTPASRPTPGHSPTAVFVAVSELSVPEAGRAAVEAAFADRLGVVDSWPGFRGLQVWADAADPCTLVMVSWWDSQQCFAAYMRSDEHRRSHQRIPTGPDRPRPRHFRRFQVIAR